jgi:trans-aconitate methyltransferase
MPGKDSVLEWFAGSGLLPFMDRLDGDDLAVFRAEMAAGLPEANPRSRPGRCCRSTVSSSFARR